MKELPEYKAEIFRRSRRRIRRRRRLFAGGISLCVCLLAVGLSVRPSQSANSENRHTPPEPTPTLSLFNTEFVRAEIVGDTFYDLQVDPAAVQELCRTVGSFFTVTTSDRGESIPAPGDSETGDTLGTVTITFATATDARLVYELTGNTLTARHTDRAVTLTDTQRDTLLKTLQGSEP